MDDSRRPGKGYPMVMATVRHRQASSFPHTSQCLTSRFVTRKRKPDGLNLVPQVSRLRLQIGAEVRQVKLILADVKPEGEMLWIDPSNTHIGDVAHRTYR